jgi:hypothetical protein
MSMDEQPVEHIRAGDTGHAWCGEPMPMQTPLNAVSCKDCVVLARAEQSLMLMGNWPPSR